MDIKTQFKNTWEQLRNTEEFNGCVKSHEFDELEQKYVVVGVMAADHSEQVRCDVLDIKYNHRPHRRLKKHRDEGLHDDLAILTAKFLTPAISCQKQGSTYDDIDTLEMLKSVIMTTNNDNVKVRALEIVNRIEKERQGAQALEPWMRVWIEDIGPNLIPPNKL